MPPAVRSSLPLLVLLPALSAACDRHAVSTSAPSPAPSGLAAPKALAPAPSASLGSPCGALPCRTFDSAREAFLATLEERPAVVAIGEAHAQKGATAPSAAKRFSDEILPSLEGRASDLLVELMMPPTGCAAAASEVRKKQEPATAPQAPTNQNEYLALGEHARLLGIVPDLLRPTCADMDSVRDAGDDAIEASLRLIARLCDSQARKLVDHARQSEQDQGKAVLVYSGMLHNDLAPPPERAAWSDAPALDAYVGGRFVSVDLVVPEYIGADATWTSLPWVAPYERARSALGGRATLLELSNKSYVLVLPETAR